MRVHLLGLQKENQLDAYTLPPRYREYRTNGELCEFYIEKDMCEKDDENNRRRSLQHSR